MKKTILTMLSVAAIAMSASAQLTTPVYYTEDFAEMGRANNFVTAPWLTYGIDAKYTKTMQDYFFPESEKDQTYYAMIEYGQMYIPFCSTEFDPAQNADQWLVSPEIEIKEDAAVLGFTAAAYAGMGNFGSGPNPYKVLLSTTGVAKEDFTTVLYEGNINSSITTEVNTRDYAIPVSGFKGKKVHLAFVATGKSVGMTGFTNLSLGDYIIKVQNSTVAIGEVGQTYDVKFSVRMRTGVACPGLTAKLFINDKETASEYFKRDFFGRNPQTVTQIITFKEAIDIKEKKAVNYRVELTPDYEGAPTSVLVGTVGVPEVEYLSNVVVEELGATGCGWCPAGIAALEYYQDTYPGTQTEGKVIAIAIHDNMNYADPMNEGVGSYVANVKALNGTSSLPQAIFNRVSRGIDVQKISEVKKQIAKKSYNDATITSVEYPALAEGEYVNGKDIKVKFDIKNAYNAEGLAFNAAAVLIENNVTGTTDGYIQENYLNDKTEAFAVSAYGEELLPYLKPFLSDGKFGVMMIPAKDMVYQHVARGIFPDFTGQKIAETWEADKAQNFEISFKVPETVIDFKNTEVVVLLLNATNQAILASDIFPYSKYTQASGVESVETAKARVAKEGSDLVVDGTRGDKVSVFSIDGKLLAETEMQADRLTINGSAWSGIVVVKVEGNRPAAAKLIF